MFEIDYRIVHSEYDDFIGQNGFLQIICNEHIYGEVYPVELEMVMDKVSLFDWFERLVRVIQYLNTEEYVALSDVESYNTWIEFYRKNKEVTISIVTAEKEKGSRDIEFNLKDPIEGEWSNQVISYSQLKDEIVKKTMEYIESIVASNTKEIDIDVIKDNLEKLRSR